MTAMLWGLLLHTQESELLTGPPPIWPLCCLHGSGPTPLSILADHVEVCPASLQRQMMIGRGCTRGACLRQQCLDTSTQYWTEALWVEVLSQPLQPACALAVDQLAPGKINKDSTVTLGRLAVLLHCACRHPSTGHAPQLVPLAG